jgi:hypothetical protein
MEFRRKVGFGLSIAALGLMATILLVGPAGLQQGELEVWVPKSYFRWAYAGPPSLETYPWATLLNEFNRDFPKVKLRFKILEREEFLRVFHSTELKSHYPDMAFVDNWREVDPLISSGAVIRAGGNSCIRYPFSGWWLWFPHSKNVGTGQAFSLWLSRSPHWKPWMVGSAAMSQNDTAAVQAVSKEVVKDVALGDSHSLSANMDREAWPFDPWGVPTNKVGSIGPLITFGNSRLAFVLMSRFIPGERSFGMYYSALVLRKVDNLWKVLLYLPGSLPNLEYYLKAFDRMELKNGQPEAIAQVSLVSPVDHARITRFPNGELEWKPLDPSPAAYVVESRAAQPAQDFWRAPNSILVWSWRDTSSILVLVSPSRGESLIRTFIPFGGGQQPCRWRVWAISGTGVVSISDWRTVDFTN